MISPADIAHWRTQVPWPTDEQIEQDLVLSRLIIEVANHPFLGEELIFRGGTCFHKLWLDRPWRYSEDLDYVRRSAGGVGPILDSIREIADIVGFDRVRTEIGQHPKARLLSTFAGGGRLQIKIEMNTFERSPARVPTTRPLSVQNPWFAGTADVPTFAVEELIATKIRALYQRKKGRDLFDLWLALTALLIPPADIAACFGPYRPEGWTPQLAIENLNAKLDDERFTNDLKQLVADWPATYTVHDAAREILDVLARISP